MAGETEDKPSGWTVDTLRAELQGQLQDLRVMLDERYATQSKAIDAAFVAQQLAMQTALAAAERAVQTALLSAKEAVAKAEAAADKRFESVNEFRGQLADQASTFLPRIEADVRIGALAEKVDALRSDRDSMHGRSAGFDKSWAALIGAVVLIGGVIAIVVALKGSP